MKIILTGATGFLGTYILKKFLDDPIIDTIVIFTRKTQDDKFFDQFSKKQKQRLQIFTLNLTDKKKLQGVSKKIKKVDSIIHIGAYVPKNSNQDTAIQTIKENTYATLYLLQMFSFVKQVIYASTAEVYGLPKTKKNISETYPPNPLSYYAVSKLIGEFYCKFFAQKNKFLLTILRFTILVGSNDMINRAIPNFIRWASQNRQPHVYGGEEKRDFLSVEDAAQAVYMAFKKRKNEIFNVGSGRGISIKEAAEIILSLFHPHLGIKIFPRKKESSDIVLNIKKAKKILKFFPKIKFEKMVQMLIAKAKNKNI